MIVLLQEIAMQLFLWLLRLTDGVMEIFSVLAGAEDASFGGRRAGILEIALSDPSVESVFWCIFILSAGLACLFGIVGLVRNMLRADRSVPGVAGRFLTSLLGGLAVLSVVMLGIGVADEVLRLISGIFRAGNAPRLSSTVFEACVGEWANGYSSAELDITSASVRDVLGDAEGAGFFPTGWKGNGMVDPDSFMYLPALISGIGVGASVLSAAVTLAKRVYEISMLYVSMPAAAATLPADDGQGFRRWTETMVYKILVAYGAVFAVNVFAMLLPVASGIEIPGISPFGEGVFRIVMIVGGAALVPAGQAMFAGLFAPRAETSSGGGIFGRVYHTARTAAGAAAAAAGAVLGKRGAKDREPSGRYADAPSAPGTEEGGE